MNYINRYQRQGNNKHTIKTLKLHSRISGRV